MVEQKECECLGLRVEKEEKQWKSWQPAGLGMFQFSGSFFHFDHVSPLRDPSPDFLLKFQLAASPQTPVQSRTVTYSSPINPVPGHFKFHPAIHSLYPLTPIAQSSCETSLQIIWNWPISIPTRGVSDFRFVFHVLSDKGLHRWLYTIVSARSELPTQIVILVIDWIYSNE